MPDACVSSPYKVTSSVNISVTFFYEIIKDFTINRPQNI